MKLLFDSPGLRSGTSGINKYYVTLMDLLHRSNACDIDLSCKYAQCAFVGRSSLPQWTDVVVTTHLDQGMDYANFMNDVAYLTGHNYDIYVPTYIYAYYANYVSTADTRILLTVHDCIAENYPEIKQYEDQPYNRRIMLQNVTKIITPSEYTKNDILRFYGDIVDESKISVVYNSISDSIGFSGYRKIYEFPYLLYVGTRYAYKNFKLLIPVLGELFRIKSELRLVCTGVPFNDEEMELSEKCGIAGRLVYSGLVPDEDVHSLMHYSEAVVISSEYEGFGYPLAEGFRAGAPVMYNDRTSLHEIAGGCGIPFNMTAAGTDFIEKFEKLEKMGNIERKAMLKDEYDRSMLFTERNFISGYMKCANEIM